MCIVVVGGGAAGFFAAVTSAKGHRKTILIEKTKSLLSKVRISGGGRCNVTHHCFDPRQLVQHYPRGGQALIGPFHRFQPRDTIEWFESRGVKLKAEEDGRMFPISDDSQTIINCLLTEAAKTGVEIRQQQGVQSIEKLNNGCFSLLLVSGERLECDRLLLATGSSKEGYTFSQSLGHTIIPPVPSLFTFNIPNFSLQELSGISVERAQLKIVGTQLQQSGPLLITHWGFSGPAALKLSAWAARHLHDVHYEADLLINWLPDYSSHELNDALLRLKQEMPAQLLLKENPFKLPKQLWKTLLEKASISPHLRLSDLPNKGLVQLAETLQKDIYPVKGKTTYKQEFVTAGGICLDEVNFKTMESRKCSGLYFAGEILDIDGVTGGFNFQNAWTTGWIAGNEMSL